MNPQDLSPEETRNARLDGIIDSAARYRARRSGFEVDDLRNEAWLFAHDAVRTRTVDGHLADHFRSKNAKQTRGEARLWTDIEKHLSEYVADVNGNLPRGVERPTYGDGQQSVQVGRRTSADIDGNDEEDRGESLRGQAFPMWDTYGGGRNNHGYGIKQVLPYAPVDTRPTDDVVPVTVADVEPTDATTDDESAVSPEATTPSRPKKRYGTPQRFPFRILEHALVEGIISQHQADLLTFLMEEGDSATDLFCRYPAETTDSIKSSVSQALRALRREPAVQMWAQSLGFNPLAMKGERWVSEHRHDDGRPGAPAPQRPFVCDCSRGEATYDEHALDKSDPFLTLAA